MFTIVSRPNATLFLHLCLVMLLAVGVAPHPVTAQQPPLTTLEWEDAAFSMQYPSEWGPADTRERGVRRISPVDVATLDLDAPDALLLTLRHLTADANTAGLPDLNIGADGDRAALENRVQTYALLQLNGLLPADAALRGVTLQQTDYGYLVQADLGGDRAVRAALLMSTGQAVALLVQDPLAELADSTYDNMLSTVAFGDAAPTDAATPPDEEPEDFVLEALEWVQGELTEDTPTQTWTFSATAGDYVAVYLTPLAEEFQPQLIVATAPAGEDDTGQPLAVGLPSFEFPLTVENVQLEPADATTTEYVVRVEAFSGVGPYEMRFATDPQPIDVAEAFEFDNAPSAITGLTNLAEPIIVPITEQGFIGGPEADAESEFFDLYSFEVRAGQYISASMIAPGDLTLDPYLELYVGERLIAEDDDALNQNTDAALGNILAPVDGTYYIRATNFGGTGAYFLYVNVADIPLPGARVPGLFPAQALTAGEPAQFFISEESPMTVWTFEGQAGQNILITVEAADTTQLDPRVWLYDAADYTLLDFNDDADGAETLNSRLEATLPADGLYLVVVDAFSGTGDYTITVQ